ncbi:MAG: hypothetical protein IKH39_06330 [Candidatus Methanomethylophilaceae archaeon]|nr:hypothetical protein [Candidatus Methanomethylophilaceae archaeon]
MGQWHLDSFKGRGSLILAATVALIAVQTKKTDGNVLIQTAESLRGHDCAGYEGILVDRN